jgi:hypothetical protein
MARPDPHCSPLWGVALALGGCNAIFGVDGLSFDQQPATAIGSSTAGAGGASSAASSTGTSAGGASSASSGGAGGAGAAGPSGEPLWALPIGGVNDDTPVGLAVASDGASWLAIRNRDPVTVSGTTHQAGMVLIKVSPDGAVLWSDGYAIGATGTPTGNVVAVDDSDNVIAAGNFVGTLVVGNVTLSNPSADDVFVMKLDAGGQVQWARSFGDAAYQYLGGIDAGAGGVIAVCGDYHGSIDFDGVALPATGGTANAFLASLDALGDTLWATGSTGTVKETGYQAAVHPAGGALCAGRFDGVADFGGASFTAAAGFDAYVASYDAFGAHRWSQPFSSPVAIDARAAVDTAGNVYLWGDFETSLDLGAGSFTAAPGTIDGFLVKRDASGAALWEQHIVGSPRVVPYVGSRVASGGFVSAGYFEGTLVFDGHQLIGSGSNDGFVVRMNDDGQSLWAFGLHGPGDERVRRVAVAPDGSVLAACRHDVPVTVAGQTFDPLGGTDALLVKLAP